MDFSAELVSWYLDNKRDLPWRNTTDAYIIWLSEIILQQTRVEQGLPYFNRFATRYPTVNHFAAAPEDDILKLWQGLGYYSRGRNMLKTAQVIQQQYNGQFPTAYTELIKLKGIGEYTAAAISSFSANEARAVVDGNVYRVLARYFGIDEPINSPKGKKLFQQLADEALDRSRPAVHNQAMMEFGAMLCKPKNPACGICPVRLGCTVFKTNATTVLPVKLKKVNVRKRFFNYVLMFKGDQLVVNKRNEGDIWANMYDLPLIETNAETSTEQLMALPEVIALVGKDAPIGNKPVIAKHVLTHQQLFISFTVINTLPKVLKPGWQIITSNGVMKLALPKPLFIFIKNFFNF